jgi:hypothetical protein
MQVSPSIPPPKRLSNYPPTACLVAFFRRQQRLLSWYQIDRESASSTPPHSFFEFHGSTSHPTPSSPTDGKKTKSPSETFKISPTSPPTEVCHFAREGGNHFLWIDTCCIDKQSPELSEALNSPYAWYQKTEIRIAYPARRPESSTRALERACSCRKCLVHRRLEAPGAASPLRTRFREGRLDRSPLPGLTDPHRDPAGLWHRRPRPRGGSVPGRRRGIFADGPF